MRRSSGGTPHHINTNGQWFDPLKQLVIKETDVERGKKHKQNMFFLSLGSEKQKWGMYLKFMFYHHFPS